jgi:hypothetical protein
MLQALRSADLRGALDSLGAIAEETAKDGSFARHGVSSLPRLVASELTTLSICDLDTGHRTVVSDRPSAISKPEIEAFDRHFHAHPRGQSRGASATSSPRPISTARPSSTTITGRSASTTRWRCRSTCGATSW